MCAGKQAESDRLGSAVIGFRLWRTEPASLDLLSAFPQGPFPQENVAWPVGDVTARCLAGEDHAAPQAGCTCGLYALHSPPEAPDREGAVIGAVLAWGGIEVHAAGFRAQYARVLCLALPDEVTRDEHALLRAIAGRYRAGLVTRKHLAHAAAEHGHAVPRRYRPVRRPPVPATVAPTRISLSASAELDLARRVRRGEAGAARRMVEAHLPLVVAIAADYRGQGLLFVDLIQTGVAGAERAAARFEPRSGYRFATYATWWIRREIAGALAGRGRSPRIPVHLVAKLNKITRAEQRMTAELDRAATAEELPEVTGTGVSDDDAER